MARRFYSRAMGKKSRKEIQAGLIYILREPSPIKARRCIAWLGLGRSPLYFSGDRPTFIAEKRSAILFGFSNGGSADCAAI